MLDDNFHCPKIVLLLILDDTGVDVAYLPNCFNPRSVAVTILTSSMCASDKIFIEFFAISAMKSIEVGWSETGFVQ